MPRELYHNEWTRRKIRNQVHLTIAGCIGPCTLANAVLLIFDGREIWLHSINDERLVIAIYDYIDSMLAAGRYLPVPPVLADHHFTVYQWDSPAALSPLPSLETARAQTGFLFLTHAATDLLTLERARRLLPDDFPPITAVNLLDLQEDERLDQFLAETLPGAEAILVRLWGGRAAFARGLDAIRDHAQARDQFLAAVPGTADLDPELASLSNVGVPIAHHTAAYLQFGGAENMAQMFRFLSDHLLATGFGYDDPLDQPQHGIYHPALVSGRDVPSERLYWQTIAQPDRPTAGILFYRSHFLSGNTAFVDALVRACEAKGLNALPVYTYSLKETMTGTQLPAAFQYFLDESGRSRVDVLITTMSFAVGNLASGQAALRTADELAGDAFAALNVPVVQAVTSGMSHDKWAASRRGLYPLDVAMNVALPEFDGRIISVPVSFRGGVGDGGDLYVPLEDRAARVAGLAARLVALRRKPNAKKRIAFVLTNSPGKASRIGNAVGLDAPESLRRVLLAMRESGYDISEIPEAGDALIHTLIDRCSYDTTVLTPWQLEQAAGQVSVEQFRQWQKELPSTNQAEMRQQWSDPPMPGTLYAHDGQVALPGLALGNVFVALQPPRGYGADPNAIYHAPDLPPTYQYHALYRWLREPVEQGGWGADAIVHLGKHGTLEWLPGKGVGLSETCYPDLFLDDLPLVYPFILNNPGEGAQAKRRAHAVIIDHMTPPLTQAGMYGGLYELAQLVDEYYQVEALDPSKLPLLQQQIWELIRRERLDGDLAAMLNVSHGDHSHAWDG
ncbi:MAG: cobaltochelatase subunit CobN [Chloroflexi bacterium]|nr:cobaltochelatase subunit CobN [Chloroflexota bacterium]